VGLSDDYLKVYAIGSKFVHGSSLLENLYSRNGKMGALSNLGLCSQLSMLAAAQCVHMLREAATFFGVPPFEDDYVAGTASVPSEDYDAETGRWTAKDHRRYLWTSGCCCVRGCRQGLLEGSLVRWSEQGAPLHERADRWCPVQGRPVRDSLGPPPLQW